MPARHSVMAFDEGRNRAGHCAHRRVGTTAMRNPHFAVFAAPAVVPASTFTTSRAGPFRARANSASCRRAQAALLSSACTTRTRLARVVHRLLGIEGQEAVDHGVSAARRAFSVESVHRPLLAVLIFLDPAARRAAHRQSQLRQQQLLLFEHDSLPLADGPATGSAPLLASRPASACGHAPSLCRQRMRFLPLLALLEPHRTRRTASAYPRRRRLGAPALWPTPPCDRTTTKPSAARSRAM